MNWVSTLIYLLVISRRIWIVRSKYIKSFRLLIKTLEKEIAINFGRVITPGITHLISRLFTFIAVNNYIGLSPYIFTSSRHLTFSIGLAFTLWVGFTITSYLKDLGHVLAHLVPLGTPYPLIPLIVIIELIRRVIRPLTLSVRLAANIVAGHLLLALISGTINPLNSLTVLILTGVVTLMVLENGVALIQAYVFRILPSLYVNEVNSIKLNYLNNSV